jgi:hypothetical protein
MARIEAIETWDTDRPGQPPMIVPLIGLKVYRAWVSPGFTMFAARFQNGAMLMAEAVLTDVPGKTHAVKILIGEEHDGQKWDDLDRMTVQTPYLKAIRGLKFCGMEGDRLVFGDYVAEIAFPKIRLGKYGEAE